MASLFMVAHQAMMLHPTCSLFLLLSYAVLLGVAWHRFAAAAMMPSPVLISLKTSTGQAIVKVQLRLLEIHWTRYETY